MRPILDATSGNRYMWKKNKHPSGVIFLDKEPELRIKPDIISTWDNIPLEDDGCKCIIFDPPHVTSLTSMWNRDPKASPNGHKKIPGWYGAFENEAHALDQIHGGQLEFSRIAPIICFKWNEASIDLDEVLKVFDRWTVKTVKQKKALRSSKTFWTQLIRKEIHT